MGIKEQYGSGNLSTLTKIDKLRELIGTGVALPQLVVVGDQSSGKSSVLEGLTGFGFPRDAELCTRYATQITCRRESEELIKVSIIPHAEASPSGRKRVKHFQRTLKKMTPDNLAQLFIEVSNFLLLRELILNQSKANKAMGIRSATKDSNLPAFSEHILKIEKCGPSEEHFTVIDVPGIFRKETEGITTEADIQLVRNMVTTYMEDSRTIILAIMPANVDPATQEILKLAKKADPSMMRTMAVLTKADLAIERTTQQIAIDHVLGKRSDLTLGYYIVKNRGPDDADMTLEQGQVEERKFFSKSPWLDLSHTGKAGIDALKARVRDLFMELIKKEFPKLKSDVAKKLSALRAANNEMGPSRSDQHTKRAYLNNMAEAFQTLARDAVNAYYTGDKIFSDRHDLRLITRIVEATENYSDQMSKNGHMRSFAADSPSEASPQPKIESTLNSTKPNDTLGFNDYPELEDIFDPTDTIMPNSTGHEDIMEYIGEVYRTSRGQDLATFGGSLLPTLFKEQSKKWEPITLSYMHRVIIAVHHFIFEMIKEVCPDDRVRDELWDGYLLEDLQGSYLRAMDRAKSLLEIEREGPPFTLNHYFNDDLQKVQGDRTVAALKEHGQVQTIQPNGPGYASQSGFFFTKLQLDTFSTSVNKANSKHVREHMHDVLKSYYKVSRKRFVDTVCQQAVNHFLLYGKDSPLRIFSTQMVSNLNEEQLDIIAAEDTPVKIRREKLARDIENYKEAMKVLRGSG
ncbi:P-loop containing nucleoside triphosphate hydrolase protein [Whalleya microplaca]|nr:P-loop containing nucleoside triphosphate hydrolase protein [Whalleya microplaca]